MSYAESTRAPPSTPPNRNKPNSPYLSPATKKYVATPNLNKQGTAMKQQEQQNFELKMRIFYLEEKLAKVEDMGDAHAHPPSQDAQALLHTYESTIERLTEQVKVLNGEKIGLSSRVAEMTSDLNMSKNRLDQSKSNDSTLHQQLSSALSANDVLNREVIELKEMLERGFVEAEIGEQTAELLNNYRSHNEKLTVENGRMVKELGGLREVKGKLGNTVIELREELTRVANNAPENTGAEMSAALKQQLDSYQEKAELDAQTIEECVQKISDLSVENRGQKEEIARLKEKEKELQVLAQHKEREIMTLSQARGGKVGSGDIRSMLEAQGSMAGELARKELEVEEMRRVATESVSRMQQAENNAAQIAEQLNLIKTTSEEVALLEAEEIARLEVELNGMREQNLVAKQETLDEKSEFEKRYQSFVGESDEMKGEILKLKRQLNSSEEKFVGATQELQALHGRSQQLSNTLHSVQVSQHGGFNPWASAGFFSGYGGGGA
ncbi:hypothetical protein TrLO_g2587, partial [Triparma laevis f. longispina]